ncbi:MAG: hypothetical protein JF888_01075 [Candidatus Dormibacteraeota bacterium]|uniref:Uncharacterized protein n=1 Tax=Candidatus Dormiibacter inghamiae TaxID=3127013 RepID=A0A934K7F0_9BACT|nr:hypothetical protein [Candidatus Dormibacteraeota bacterium]MBJ7605287.1 hypothetical protein [Candidatus Dormibacteraeota bacterium]
MAEEGGDGWSRPGGLDQLITGAIDTHAHGYPEFSLQHHARLDDVRLLVAMRDAGIAGIVMKSHLWPTMDRAYYVHQQVPEVRIYPSITLNSVVGGVDPDVVEAAASLGAKVVFFPTWTSHNDRSRQGISTMIQGRFASFVNDRGPGVEVTSGDRLKPEAEAVLDVAKERGLLVQTGHISIGEALLVCAGARDRGVPVVLSHPTSRIIGASLEQLKQAVALGAFVEFCVLHGFSLFHAIPPAETAWIIKELGAEHCILSTDSFNDWAPPEPEMLRMGAGQLLSCGLSEGEVRLLIHDNPRRALRLSAN